ARLLAERRWQRRRPQAVQTLVLLDGGQGLELPPFVDEVNEDVRGPHLPEQAVRPRQQPPGVRPTPSPPPAPQRRVGPAAGAPPTGRARSAPAATGAGGYRNRGACSIAVSTADSPSLVPGVSVP